MLPPFLHSTSFLLNPYYLHCSLLFREINYVEAFEEFEYELLPLSDATKDTVKSWTADGSIIPYLNTEEERETKGKILL